MVGTDNKNRHCDADRRKQSICRRLAALAESMDHRVASAMLLVMTKRRTGANICARSPRRAAGAPRDFESILNAAAIPALVGTYSDAPVNARQRLVTGGDF